MPRQFANRVSRARLGNDFGRSRDVEGTTWVP